MIENPWIKKTVPWLIGAGWLAGAAAVFYFWQQEERATDGTPAPAVTTPAASEPARAETAPQYPVPQPQEGAAAAAKPLPELNDSDPVLRDTLAGLIGAESLKKFVAGQDIARHIVVTVDNLPRKTFAVRLSPLNPVGGQFRTSTSDGNLAIAPENAARYTPYVRAIEQLNSKKLVAGYGHLYPLFQKAYEDLGYPKAYFNDRLVVVIDHLLATPDIRGPIEVVAPHVQFRFADPELEALSSGQKVLIRMGSANAAVVKTKLREIRGELAGQNRSAGRE